MASGRAALASGDLPQAIRMFTKVVSLPEGPSSPEAKELLGVAREKLTLVDARERIFRRAA